MKNRTKKRKTRISLRRNTLTNKIKYQYLGGKTANKNNKLNQINKIKSIKLAKVNCSPKPKNEINEFTCYTNKSLYKLKDLWNARHPDVKITSTSPKEIHHQISEKLGGICTKESCWLKQKAEFGPI